MSSARESLFSQYIHLVSYANENHCYLGVLEPRLYINHIPTTS